MKQHCCYGMQLKDSAMDENPFYVTNRHSLLKTAQCPDDIRGSGPNAEYPTKEYATSSCKVPQGLRLSFQPHGLWLMHMRTAYLPLPSSMSLAWFPRDSSQLLSTFHEISVVDCHNNTQ
jgi:hypothetical protein